MITDLALWNSLPVPALTLAADDTISDSNSAAELFLNSSARSLAGAGIWDRVAVDAPLGDALTRCRAYQNSLFVNDVYVGSSDRPTVQCNIMIAPLQGTDGHLLMLIAPREMASRMLQQSSTSKAAKSAIGMAEMLAHEIKNPLAGITGAAQLLSMNLSTEDRELTDLIVEECRRIVKLLEQVEQFGNLRPPGLQAVNLHDVLDRARQSATLGFGAHMHFIEDYDPSLPRALADPDQLLQIFLNLLKNACEAGAEGGVIRLHSFYQPSLRVRRNDGSHARLPLQIEISDDGPGLPPDIAEQVFEPFVSGRENGTGLGLALVSKLVADNGGWISADSAPGHTVFRISLPRAPDDMPEPRSTTGEN